MKNLFKHKIIFTALTTLFALDLLHSKSFDELLELSLRELTQLQVITKKSSPKKEEDEQVYHNKNIQDSVHLLPTCLQIDSCPSKIPFTSRSKRIFWRFQHQYLQSRNDSGDKIPNDFQMCELCPILSLKESVSYCIYHQWHKIC